MNTTINERITSAINEIIDALNACRAMSGKSWQQLADECHKDVSTLRRQFERDSNPKASTLVELAMRLDAKICVETEISRSENVAAYRERLNELQTERDQLRVEADHLRELVQQQSVTIGAQARRIERYDLETEDMRDQMKRRLRVMERMYESIEQKDEMIRGLLQQKDELTDKLLKDHGIL